MIAYMDSSAVVKGCVLEAGSDAVGDACERALSGELEVAFSAWNVGEVLGVLDRYLRREWLGREDYPPKYRGRRGFLFIFGGDENQRRRGERIEYAIH